MQLGEVPINLLQERQNAVYTVRDSMQRIKYIRWILWKYGDSHTTTFF